ncbi:MAG: efflux RND transporter periplasmic adaptor subunit [Bacteroidetes bacterium]|jgi:RND family efflux transporter MFP subunit|nr:efflux RND transporter periplasmic adaptor subunit [Bacteroidota bacterium]NBX64421.1 efflux RND transporter periplasmic adaptor subunit [Bacteroidota bacterium]
MPQAPQSNNPTMKRYILSMSLIAAFLMSACGEKSNTPEAKKAKLESLKKEIAQLQAEASVLEKELNAGAVADMGKTVEIATVKKGLFQSFISIEGVADANESTIATPKVPGTVVRVLVQPGTTVSAGQVLAQLDNTAISQGKNELNQQLVFVTTLFEKQKRLWEKGVGTEVQYLSAKNQKEALEKSMKTLEAQIDMYNIKSPIAGTLESADAKVGQAVAPGMPLFRVVNMSNIKVKADVAESHSKKIKAGDQIKIYFPDLKTEVNTNISFAARFIDPLNRTFRVETKLPKVDNLKPNMIAKLKIVDYENKSAISVNSNSVQTTESGSFVVVAKAVPAKNGTNTFVAERRKVSVGKSSEGLTEILEGLNEGDMVITAGYQELNDGQAISGEWMKGN